MKYYTIFYDIKWATVHNYSARPKSSSRIFLRKRDPSSSFLDLKHEGDYSPEEVVKVGRSYKSKERAEKMLNSDKFRMALEDHNALANPRPGSSYPPLALEKFYIVEIDV